MRILSIETSGRTGTIAVAEAAGEDLASLQTRVIRRRSLPEEHRTARTLVPSLAEVLRETGWPPQSIDAVGVCWGPGSFTGLRIGITAAKTFAYAVGARLVGVSTLAALAAAVESREGPVAAILNAQRQELFAARFALPVNERTAQDHAVEVVGEDAWLASLAPGDTVAGPPLAHLARRLPSGVTVASQDSWAPRADTVALLAARLDLRGAAIDPMQMAPRYYRRSAAEEKANRSKA